MKSIREKRARQKWLAEGLCTKCGKTPPKENHRLCDGCGERTARQVVEHRYKLKIKEDDDRS